MGGKYFSDVCLIRSGRRSILTKRNSLLLNCMKSTGNVIHPGKDWQTRPFLQNMTLKYILSGVMYTLVYAACLWTCCFKIVQGFAAVKLSIKKN